MTQLINTNSIKAEVIGKLKRRLLSDDECISLAIRLGIAACLRECEAMARDYARNSDYRYRAGCLDLADKFSESIVGYEVAP